MTGPDPEKRESEHSESDVQDDPKVAASRADGDEGGSYVGRTFADDDFDSGESGAEARSTD
ncbi:hypothetical protein ACWDUN_12365 [Mycobacterium sp. NPDC003323]